MVGSAALLSLTGCAGPLTIVDGLGVGAANADDEHLMES